MPEAIRPASMISGFEKGMNMVDRSYDRKHRREMNREAIEMRKDEQAARNEHREFQRNQAIEQTGIARERLDMERERFESASAIANGQAKRAEQKHQWEADEHKRQQRELELKELTQESGQVYSLLANGNFDAVTTDSLLSLHNKAMKARRPNLSPLNQDNDLISRVRKVEPLLEQLKAGNIEYVNSPGNLAILSDLPGWKDKLNVGVGEPGRNGSVINRKEIAELQAGPNGRIIPMLRVHTEDGESYLAEMSAFRSTNPNEPVVAADAGKLIDNAYSQVMIARLFDNPEIQKKLSLARKDIFSNPQDSSRLPAQAQMFEYLLGKGYSQDQAEKMAFAAKGKSVEEQANLLAKAEFEAQGEYAENPKSLREFRSEWIQTLKGPQSQTGSNDVSQSSEFPEALQQAFDTARANPKNEKYTDEQIRQAILQQAGANK